MSEVLVGREPGSEAVGPPLIELAGVEKVYRTGKVELPGTAWSRPGDRCGEMVAIVGPSGSGKSTIMNMITGIDRPTAGTVTVDGERIDEMSEEELAVWRGRRVGVVFQFFQLLPTLTALENAMLPMDFARRGSKRERRERALHNLELVGLADKGDRLPSEMSGGQQQRVAIARALASYPTLSSAMSRPAIWTRRRRRRCSSCCAGCRRGRDGAVRHARSRAGRARGQDDHDPRRRRGRRVMRRRSCRRQFCASRSRT